MYELAPDEKTTPVMAYSRNKRIHGDLVTRENVRVSILPRLQGLSNYLHFLNAEIWFFGAATPRLLTYSEYFFPVERMIGLHLAPPASEPLDYDATVTNRTMHDFHAILGAFLLQGKIRLSTHADLVANLELAHSTWLSMYEVDISSSFLEQMPVIHVPMLLVSPAQASFGI